MSIQTRRSTRMACIVPAVALTLVAAPPMARAEDSLQACGRVLAADGKTPVVDSMVAVYDEKGNIVGHGKTDAEGRYVVDVPLRVLHLPQRKRGGGFLSGLVKGAGKVVGAVAPVAAMVPGAGLAGLAAGGAGQLGAIGGAATQGLTGRLIDGAMRGAAPGMAGGARGMSVNPEMLRKQMQAAGVPKEQIEQALAMYAGRLGGLATLSPTEPGALIVKIAPPGQREAQAVGQVYHVREDRSADGKAKKGLVGDIDPMRLSPEAGDATFERTAFVLEDATADPAMVEYGQTTRISVTMASPQGSPVPLAVIARVAKTGQVFELKPVGGGRYEAEIPVDKSLPKNDQTISILAYALEPGETGRSKKAEDAVNRAGMWKLDKPFEYNPLVVLSRNRADVTLSIVEPNTKR